MKPQLPISDYRKLSDEELVYRYVHRGEQVAISHLYERYGHLVLGVCYKYLQHTEAAKDATQQIFIKLLDDLKKYTVERFKPWLFQVAKNYCLMQLRQSVPVINNAFDTGTDMEFEDNLHQKMEDEQVLLRLEEAMRELNTEQRTCIELFYLQKISYAEIVAKTGYTMLQVKSHIQNGKRNLKIKLELAGGLKS
ncbi:RNA polymerase sigma factor [Chitinophagaceae bacterium MMS25-I14]